MRKGCSVTGQQAGHFLCPSERKIWTMFPRPALELTRTRDYHKPHPQPWINSSCGSQSRRVNIHSFIHSFIHPLFILKTCIASLQETAIQRRSLSSNGQGEGLEEQCAL